MSQEIYDRGIVRETSIWPPFEYYGRPPAELQETRELIFGLYSAVYKHGFDYLQDIETERLQQLLDDYNMNMSQLDTDEQNLVLEIAAKRYVKQIEIQIENSQFETKRQEIDAAGQKLDAKIAALEADREELDTKREQIQLAKEKAEVRIAEIEAQVEQESLKQDYVAIEISEKELKAKQAELETLNAALQGLDIQLAITEAGIEMEEIAAQKTQYQADIAMINADIETKSLTPIKLKADQTELEAIEYEIETVTQRRVELIESGGESVSAQITATENQQTQESELHTALSDEQTARTSANIRSIEQKETAAKTDKEIKEQDYALDKTLATDRKDSRETIATKRTEIDKAREYAASKAKEAAIDAATTIAAANITTTLTHELGNA